jgi:REP element-mobilizing transposase RayT
MRTRYRIVENEYPYFMTWTMSGWLPVFTREWAVEEIYRSWNHLQEEGEIELLGYCILENHLHLIAVGPSLANAVARSRSFTARQIIDGLKQRGESSLLKQLQWHKLKHKRDREFQLWQEGKQPKQIRSDDVMWQKLEYIHYNPVRRGYVDDPLHWRYSSARNYAKESGLIGVTTDWM